MRIAIALIFALGFASARGESPRAFMKKGQAMFQAEDFEQAATNFGAAAAGAVPANLDPAVAKYNEAAAALKLGNPGGAAQLYAESLRSPDLRLQQKAYYNRGNALAYAAQGMEEAQQLENAVKTMGEAIGMYENAIALDPKDQDPKVNFELALKKKAQLEEKLKQQPQQPQQNQDQNQDKDQKKDDKENDQSQQDQESQKDKEEKARDEQQKQDQQTDSQAQSPQPAKPEDMTKEEAALLLDAAKQQEQADREQIRLIVGRPVPVEKDW